MNSFRMHLHFYFVYVVRSYCDLLSMASLYLEINGSFGIFFEK